MDTTQRKSSKQKTKLVLEIIKGESIDIIALRNKIKVEELIKWHARFIECGTKGLVNHREKKTIEDYKNDLNKLRIKLSECQDRIKNNKETSDLVISNTIKSDKRIKFKDWIRQIYK